VNTADATRQHSCLRLTRAVVRGSLATGVLPSASDVEAETFLSFAGEEGLAGLLFVLLRRACASALLPETAIEDLRRTYLHQWGRNRRATASRGSRSG
jgi:hypothetical protein